jgi:hypothetical protein
VIIKITTGIKSPKPTFHILRPSKLIIQHSQIHYFKEIVVAVDFSSTGLPLLHSLW